MKKEKTKKPSADKDQKATKITLTKTLPCKLSEKELARAGKDLADNMDKIEAIEQQKTTADDGFKKDIGLLEEVTTTLRGMLKSGAQEREVKCEQITDYRNGEVRIKRLDTGFFQLQHEDKIGNRLSQEMHHQFTLFIRFWLSFSFFP